MRGRSGQSPPTVAPSRTPAGAHRCYGHSAKLEGVVNKAGQAGKLAQWARARTAGRVPHVLGGIQEGTRDLGRSIGSRVAARQGGSVALTHAGAPRTPLLT